MNIDSLFLNLLIIVPVYIIMFLSLYFVNDFKSKGRLLFGISIPKSYVDDSRIIYLKNKYKINVSIITSILFMISILLLGFSLNSLAILIFVFGDLIICSIFYYVNYKKLLKIKKDENWNELSAKKVYVSLDVPREQNIVSLWWYVIPFAVSILSLIIVLLKINNLPALTPLHFGFNGADSFGDGSSLATKLNVLLLPVLNIFSVSMFYFSVKSHGARSEKINGGTPSEIYLKNSLNKKNLSQLSIILSIVVSLMISYMSLAIIGLIEVNITVMFIASIIPLLIAAISIPIFIRNTRKKENLPAKSEDEEDIYIDDDTPYKFGGLIYYNKNNPSTFVPKRMGIGYTINTATVGGKLFWLFIVLILIISFIPTLLK